MKESPTYIAFVVAILGLSLPILLQVVARLDDKYNSTLILKLFNKEKVRNIFILCLIVSLICTILWSLKLPPLIDINGLNFIIENSASLLLLVSSIALIISFFFLITKILVYYSPEQFIQYLIRQHRKQFKGKNRAKDEYDLFKAISDVLLKAIKNQEETIAKTITDFMYEEFQKQRDIDIDTPVEYPAPYLTVVNKISEEIAHQEHNKIRFLEHHTVGGVWLLGEFNDRSVSDSVMPILEFKK